VASEQKKNNQKQEQAWLGHVELSGTLFLLERSVSIVVEKQEQQSWDRERWW
jgi:hypothetical protein